MQSLVFNGLKRSIGLGSKYGLIIHSTKAIIPIIHDYQASTDIIVRQNICMQQFRTTIRNIQKYLLNEQLNGRSQTKMMYVKRILKVMTKSHEDAEDFISWIVFERPFSLRKVNLCLICFLRLSHIAPLLSTKILNALFYFVHCESCCKRSSLNVIDTFEKLHIQPDETTFRILIHGLLIQEQLQETSRAAILMILRRKDLMNTKTLRLILTCK
ncbi:hypothetical protein SJAG_06428 [Schizosaccharomyces japonicus yFS275]|uniref:Uncharacterized protein n=1 Tax=Schizosaccharomyces japonicus (strain yFS275 / FY16936) TaxID=402676 RepID=T0TAY5_SCHJY|nr:hypothetical protein SJAG_06428 [Schizosaccharomyces japonicus yFS275]EQC52973.1 hypothetical protein SJAG_06428 [Schizosaccharomyces japonicus yFS275]